MSTIRVWIADDDRGVRVVLGAALRDAGLEVREFADAKGVLDALTDDAPDVLFSDVRMPGKSGLELLAQLATLQPSLPVIVMSAFTDVSTTAAAYRHGAFDYLPKPFDLDVALDMVMRAMAQHGAEPPRASSERLAAIDLIGNSMRMRELFRAMGRMASSDMTVLITGETGTGKELVARALHRESRRAREVFVALNTAAIPSDLLESELFGHEAGAFTGATRRHAGRFEQAHGGTLFLDEIGDMPLALQTRLLRVLAAGEFYRVGGRELIRSNVRVLAATHQDLDAKVERGEFRADLLHRLDVLRLHNPALRERREDIAPLATHFLKVAAEQAESEAKRFAPAAMAVLQAYDWPGNVRQLENVCRRLALIASGREIRVADLPPNLKTEPAETASGWTQALAAWVEQELAQDRDDLHARAQAELERVLFAAALARCDGHRQNAARVLGLGRNTLTRKLGSSRRRKPR
ncbi:MAG: nitrogen regulation protein NR(I) [Dokdonella sp.]|jgi:two-component system nitrogen regulation response regulator GlnG|uniref:nitrogen regulation protein NR(I) n=1 Tax=Dokdonella sp. TaxID=2291710 RepID=UPI002BEAEDA1|nr:nitrogen regulation protein NR(I) [Dokdonella sp.]HNV08061.1 nitrogen regulation protein NR(I) [Dokdonella sp.]